MNRRQAALSANRTAGTLAVIALAAVILLATAKDETDDLALRAAAHEQARQAAQPDAWPKLVAEGCAMVACDRMRAK